ncbi:MAG: hypothetical protein V3U67_09710 [Gemmatimonadota bacterium]
MKQYRRWEPSTEQIIAVGELILSDEVWEPRRQLRVGLDYYVEQARRELHPRPNPASKLVARYARWLRFPWLDHPEPPMAHPLNAGRAETAARALLRATLPGHPGDKTLQNTLSRVRRRRRRRA